MMYIGTSLGRCLRSILIGEVSKDDVVLIITRTKAENFAQFIFVVKTYYEDSNYSANHPSDYDLSVKPWDEVEELATYLFESGKIHQPRNVASLGSSFIHPELRKDVWIEISPKNRNTTPAVVQAYEHYKMLDSLTQ
jgi:hypothetical protein